VSGTQIQLNSTQASQAEQGLSGQVAVANNPSALQSLANAVAAIFQIPQQLFDAQIQQESGFNPNAINPSSGATGIAQFIPSTVTTIDQQQGIVFNPDNASQSLYQAGLLDAQDFNSAGNWYGALQDYGTLPATGKPMTTAQSALASLAQSFGSQIGSNATPTNSTSSTAPITTTGASTTATGSGQSCTGLGSFLDFACWTGVIDNAGIIAIALVLLIGALLVLGEKTGTTVTLARASNATRRAFV
jgi:hypothetical protein